MKKNLKDKKITIYELIRSVDGEGFSSKKYKPIHPGQLWAYVRHLSAKEWWSASLKTEQDQEERFFTVNWRNDVTVDHFILYKDVWYNIVRVDPYEDYRDDIKLYAQTMKSKPKTGDVLTYK